MPSLDMLGAYDFTNEEIKKRIGSGPGNYALGYKKNQQSFVVLYIGRSDDNLRQRLLQHIENPIDNRITHYKYRAASSPQEAFYRECSNYHEFDLEHNINHPAKPHGASWKCPHNDCKE